MSAFLDPVKLPLAAAAGVLATLLLGTLYVLLVHDPAIRAETRRVVEAEAAQNTKEALNEIGNAAERARAMRRYCAGRGVLYDFEAGKCAE